MLCRAQSYLPEGLHLEIQDAYRSEESQRALFRMLCEELKLKHPEWTEADLLARTNDFVASPYAPVPPPHTTGGAVDVTLVDDSGLRLDMTSPYEWDETSAPTSFPGISERARRNRRILQTAMSKAGFTNYLGEWWHWSYGDSCWAVRLGRDTAIYGRVDESSAYAVRGACTEESNAGKSD
jgi:D-alanyl-D-alanine dipeptidase